MPGVGRTFSYLREGFAATIREPVLFPAELVWRWCFAFAAWILVGASAIFYLDSLKLAPGDEYLLSTWQPRLELMALEHALHSCLPRILVQQMVLFFGLLLLWSAAASAGRSAILTRLVEMFRGATAELAPARTLRPIFLFNLLRAGWTVLAVLATGASLLFGVALASRHRAAGAGLFLVFGTVLSVATGLMLNWFLGLVPLLAVRNNSDRTAAVSQTVDFCCRCAGPLFGLTAGFLGLRVFWAGIAMSMGFSALALLPNIAVGWGLVLLALLAMGYFAGDDLLLLARLGAYAALAEDDANPLLSTGEPRPSENPTSSKLLPLALARHAVSAPPGREAPPTQGSETPQIPESHDPQ